MIHRIQLNNVYIRYQSFDIIPLKKDDDVDGDQRRISAIVNHPSGKTIIFPYFIRYIPAKNFAWNDTIDYQVIDFEGGVSSSKIFIHVKN